MPYVLVCAVLPSLAVPSFQPNIFDPAEYESKTEGFFQHKAIYVCLHRYTKSTRKSLTEGEKDPSDSLYFPISKTSVQL